MTKNLRVKSSKFIDETYKVSFRFNGTTYYGYNGDTLASALLANGIHLVGRSFKYHRPRGIMTAGSEEPNAIIQLHNNSSRTEHEATTSKIDDDQLFYCLQRGINEEDAVALIINGFCKEVLQALPMEFALEAQKLVAISLEGSVG